MENFKQFFIGWSKKTLSESQNKESYDEDQFVLNTDDFIFTFKRLGKTSAYGLINLENNGSAEIPVDFKEYKTQKDKFCIFQNMVNKWKKIPPSSDHVFETMRGVQGKPWMMITKTDMEFFSVMYDLLKNRIYEINDRKIVFNLINKTINIKNNEKDTIEQIKKYKDEFFGKDGVDINIDETRDQLLNVQDAVEFRRKSYENSGDKFDDSANNSDDQDEYGSEEENVNEDILNTSKIKTRDSKPVKDWEKKEVSVRDGLNLLITGKNDSKNHVDEPGAAWVGGSNDSDVMYTIKDQDKNMLTGFVEVKLNYEDAGYFKFSLMFKDGKLSKVRDTYYRENDTRKTSYTDKKFNKLLTDIMTTSDAIRNKFLQLGENVQFCIDSLNQIENVQEKLNFNPEEAKNFPEGFEQLAKVFNFFVLEWVRKFMFLSSNYIYFKLEGNENEAEKQRSIAKIIKEKFKKLCGNDGRMMFSDEFTKFREIYKLFISTDDFLPSKKPHTDGDEEQNQDETDKKYTLFTFEDSESENGKSFKDQIIDSIDSYYKRKGCRYIEIGDDVYFIGGNSKNKGNPLELKNVQSFAELKKNQNVGVKVIVSVRDASRLHLTTYLKTQKEKLTMSKSIEDTAKNQ